MPEQTPDKTIMTEWAESSLEFSAAKKKILNEFGYSSVVFVKADIRRLFPQWYINVRKKGNGYVHYDHNRTPLRLLDPDYITAVDFAKAILVASALLETNDIREIIEWAHT